MARPLDPFRTLELPRDATLDDVKAAYRRLAKLYHPDSAGERALARFLAVQAAYEALTEGPGRLRSAIGGRARTTTRPGRPAPDGGAGRSSGAGPRGARGTASGGAGSPSGWAGSRAGSPAGGAAGFSTPQGEGGAGAHGGSSRTRGTAGSRPRRTRRPPGSTSYDGAESEPFEPQWEGASWYGGSSGTYWTINPREFADPRKHGPEYQARGRAGTSRRRDGAGMDPPGGLSDAAGAAWGPRQRRARPGDGPPTGRRGGAPGSDAAPGSASAPSSASGATFDAGGHVPGGDPFLGDDPWGDDPWPSEEAVGPPWSARRSGGADVSALSLVAAALLGLGLVAGLFAVLTLPVTPGAASIVPLVAFSGIAIVILVRVLRRDGRPRA